MFKISIFLHFLNIFFVSITLFVFIFLFILYLTLFNLSLSFCIARFWTPYLFVANRLFRYFIAGYILYMKIYKILSFGKIKLYISPTSSVEYCHMEYAILWESILCRYFCLKVALKCFHNDPVLINILNFSKTILFRADIMKFCATVKILLTYNASQARGSGERG